MVYATNLFLQDFFFFFFCQIDQSCKRRCQEPQLDTEFGCRETWVDTSTHGESWVFIVVMLVLTHTSAKSHWALQLKLFMVSFFCINTLSWRKWSKSVNFLFMGRAYWFGVLMAIISHPFVKSILWMAVWGGLFWQLVTGFGASNNWIILHISQSINISF